jgi:hypothetical protein
MRTSAITVLFAVAAVAAPAPALDLLDRRDAVLAQGTASIDASVYDQGDGYYHAVYNETTAALDVAFTPMAELDALTAVTPLDRRSTHDLGGTHGLTKRDTTCSQRFSSDTPTLDRANIQLANNANNRVYNYNDWGWVCIQSQSSFLCAILIVAQVHLGKETSFFCSRDNNQYLWYQLIIDMQTVVSQRCGGSDAYGYDRRFLGGGVKDL